MQLHVLRLYSLTQVCKNVPEKNLTDATEKQLLDVKNVFAASVISEGVQFVRFMRLGKDGFKYEERCGEKDDKYEQGEMDNDVEEIQLTSSQIQIESKEHRCSECVNGWTYTSRTKIFKIFPCLMARHCKPIVDSAVTGSCERIVSIV